MKWLAPTKVQSIARFIACDPWHADQKTPFFLDRCFDRTLDRGFVPGYVLEDESRASRFAIRSDLGRDYRFLPDSLTDLYRRGKVPAERLPALLKGLEPDLKRSDYFRLWSLNQFQRNILTYSLPFVGAVHALLGSVLLLDGGDWVNVFQIVLGVTLAAVSLKIAGGLNARRKRQTDWALRQCGA